MLTISFASPGWLEIPHFETLNVPLAGPLGGKVTRKHMVTHESVYEEFLNLLLQTLKVFLFLYFRNWETWMTIERQNWKCGWRRTKCSTVVFIRKNIKLTVSCNETLQFIEYRSPFINCVKFFFEIFPCGEMRN